MIFNAIINQNAMLAHDLKEVNVSSLKGITVTPIAIYNKRAKINKPIFIVLTKVNLALFANFL